MTLFVGDRALLDAFRRGERAALERVYEAYFPSVRRILEQGTALGDGTWLKGVANDELSELIQDVFIRAFTPASRLGFDGLRDYRPYLQAICRNTLVDWWRKRGREPRLVDIDAIDLQMIAISKNAIDDRELQRWADPAVIARVQSYLASLPEHLRALHDARYVRGLSQRDAAEALGVGRQKVRTLEDTLKKGLRRELLKHQRQNNP